MLHTMNSACKVPFKKMVLSLSYLRKKYKIGSIWMVKGDPLLTLRFDGYRTETVTYVVNFTESAIDLTIYVDCVNHGKCRENYPLCVDLTIKLLEKGAAEPHTQSHT